MTQDAVFHHLTGAYALDALPEAEVQAVEAHLRRCPACALETAEFRETVARLGTAASETPPDALRFRVDRQLARAQQLPPRRRLATTTISPTALLRGFLYRATCRRDRIDG